MFTIKIESKRNLVCYNVANVWLYMTNASKFAINGSNLDLCHLKYSNKYRCDRTVIVHCVKLFNTMKNDDMGTKREIYG